METIAGYVKQRDLQISNPPKPEHVHLLKSWSILFSSFVVDEVKPSPFSLYLTGPLINTYVWNTMPLLFIQFYSLVLFIKPAQL